MPAGGQRVCSHPSFHNLANFKGGNLWTGFNSNEVRSICVNKPEKCNSISIRVLRDAGCELIAEGKNDIDSNYLGRTLCSFQRDSSCMVITCLRKTEAQFDDANFLFFFFFFFSFFFKRTQHKWRGNRWGCFEVSNLVRCRTGSLGEWHVKWRCELESCTVVLMFIAHKQPGTDSLPYPAHESLARFQSFQREHSLQNTCEITLRED